MLGFQYIKFQPSMFVLKYKKGRIVKEGVGLSFIYYAPSTSLVAVPITSMETPFIFEEITQDFQNITVQGYVTYRVNDPKKIATLLNYTLDRNGITYISDDPDKLSQRMINIVRILIQKQLKEFKLQQALTSSQSITSVLRQEIKTYDEVIALGIDVLGIAILAIKPTPETSKALEAETREQVLKQADDAVYIRRNASVEQERRIRENELNTEIAVEIKRREIKETQLEARTLVQQKRQEYKNREMDFNIKMQEKERSLVELRAKNQKILDDAQADQLEHLLKIYSGVPSYVLQHLMQSGMGSEQLIAIAFQSIAEKADKIKNLNISPDLLKELINNQGQ